MIWNILLHSYRMIANNLLVFLRITLLPMLLVSALEMVLNFVFYGHFLPTATYIGSADNYIFSAFILALVIFVAKVWVIIGWHRYVLLGEIPDGIFPRWHASEIFRYIIKSLWITLIVVLPIILVSVLLILLFHKLIPDFIFIFAMSTCIVYFLTRVSLVLPAMALGEYYKLSDAWCDTIEIKDSILGLSIIWGIACTILVWLPKAVPESTVALLSVFLLQTVFSLWTVSVLTTLYGFIVEKREL